MSSSSGQRESVWTAYRELLVVALPLIASSGSVTLMHTIDRLFLFWHDPDEFAASMPAALTNYTLMAVAFGTAMYVATFVGQYEGAGRPQRVARAVWQGVHVALAGGLLTLLLVPAADAIFRAIGHTPRIRAFESAYFRVLCWSALPTLLAAALSGFFSGRGRTVAVLLANLAAALVNVALDWVFVFGHLGWWEWGIRGAGVATVIAAWVNAGVLAAAIALPRHRPYGFSRQWAIDWGLLGRLLRYGVPNGFIFMVDVGCFLLFIAIVGRLGALPLKATNLAFTLNMLAFVPMVGLSTAVSTLVGRRIGAGDPDAAARLTWLALWLAEGYMACWVVAYLTIPGVLVAPFLDATGAEAEQLRGIIATILKFVAAYSLFDALLLIFSGSIRGAGDTLFSMAYTFACGAGLLVLPTYVLCEVRGGGLLTAWTVATVYIVVFGTGYLLRFLGGKWRTMKVIEDEPEDACIPPAPVPERPEMRPDPVPT